MVATIVVVMIVLGLVPLFVLFGLSCDDLNKTRREIKQNEEDIRRMIYGK